MFSNFFSKKEKPRVFLGNLTVVPRTSFGKIDEWGFYKQEDVDSELRKGLEEIFSCRSLQKLITL